MKGQKKTNLTTLCYLERDGKYLMMHRVKKEHDINRDKWVGVGGHFEPDETPEECLLREVCEETGLMLDRFALRGIITFMSDKWQTEYMFLYTADRFHGDFIGRDACREGTLEWVDKDAVYDLPIWKATRSSSVSCASSARYSHSSCAMWVIRWSKRHWMGERSRLARKFAGTR